MSFDPAIRMRGGTGNLRRRAYLVAAAILVAGIGVPARAQVITYEGNVFPEDLGWERRLSGTPGGERAIENGWFVQYVQLPDGWPEPTGEREFYRMPLTSFVGTPRFFVEWRAITDNPAWPIDFWAIPTIVTLSGKAASTYHTVFTESAAVLLRDVVIPRVIVPVSIGRPHVYRVEVFLNEYTWYIDGVVTDSGIPEGPYPDANARITWGVGREYADATTAWDFVRVGRIPEDSSGDYDSDGSETLLDQYFVADCLTKDGPGIFGGPGNDAGPGCRFADFDADGDVDLIDFAEFQNLFTPAE